MDKNENRWRTLSVYNRNPHIWSVLYEFVSWSPAYTHTHTYIHTYIHTYVHNLPPPMISPLLLTILLVCVVRDRNGRWQSRIVICCWAWPAQSFLFFSVPTFAVSKTTDAVFKWGLLFSELSQKRDVLRSTLPKENSLLTACTCIHWHRYLTYKG
jgi:hypothetical protein